MIRKLSLLLAIVAVGFGVKAYHDTMSDPETRHFVFESARLPQDSEPVTIALVADIHMEDPNMPPERVERIVKQVNALDVDLIALLGDYVTDKRDGTRSFSPDEIIAPLGELSARLGVVLVPGNHDHWYGWTELAKELAEFDHIDVLQNEAIQRGSLSIGGIDDETTGNDDVTATLSAMDQLDGISLVLTHTPDVFPELNNETDLVLAGHTHCGQIAYPWGGAPVSVSKYGQRYLCGVVVEDGKTLITSAGLGTSTIPMRLFTQLEIWLIEIRPPQRDAATADNS